MVVAEAQEIGMMELPQQEDLVGVVGVVGAGAVRAAAPLGLSRAKATCGAE